MAVTINLADYVERRRAANTVDIELGDGTIIGVPPAELWSEEVFAILGEGDADKAMRLILGEEQTARFVAEGGNSRILNGIIKEAQGLTAGESEASSD